MNVFWDCDGTLISYEKNGKPPPPHTREIRPYAAEVLRTLEQFGVVNYLWSRAGEDNACEAAELLGISQDRCFRKPWIKDADDIKAMDVKPDLVIDDNPDDNVLVFPHIIVSTYSGGEDAELLRILPEIRAHLEAVEGKETLAEAIVRFKRKRVVPSKLKTKRKQYYRKHKSQIKRYRKSWKRKAKTKRLMKIRRRLKKKFKRRLKGYRMRVRV
jgi:hypothetical protein